MTHLAVSGTRDKHGNLAKVAGVLLQQSGAGPGLVQRRGAVQHLHAAPVEAAAQSFLHERIAELPRGVMQRLAAARGDDKRQCGQLVLAKPAFLLRLVLNHLDAGQGRKTLYRARRFGAPQLRNGARGYVLALVGHHVAALDQRRQRLLIVHGALHGRVGAPGGGAVAIRGEYHGVQAQTHGGRAKHHAELPIADDTHAFWRHCNAPANGEKPRILAGLPRFVGAPQGGCGALVRRAPGRWRRLIQLAKCF